jgi:predicted ATPase/DNA-binding SARP family transcriptional activator
MRVSRSWLSINSLISGRPERCGRGVTPKRGSSLRYDSLTLEYSVLGPLEVTGPDGTLSITSRNERIVLAVLAAWAGKVVSRDRLIDAIWADAPPRSSVKIIQNVVMRLRTQLGKDAIETRPAGYVLRSADAVDSRRFERLAAEGRSAARAGRWEASARAYETATNLWRGEALVELATWQPGRWEAARLEEQYRCVVEELAEAELARGRHRECLPILNNNVSEEPLRERRWALLMLALYRCGQQAEALRAYQRASAVLGDLGLVPGAELHSLERAISVGDSSIGVPQRTELDWAAARDSDAPHLPDGPASNLPLQVNSFVGRDHELAEIANTICETRLVTLTGVGGVGKTRLAIAVAADVLPAFPGGAWFCELAVVNDSQAMVQVIAAALGVPIRPGVSIEHSVVEFLRQRRLLVVLDNCEHLLDDAARFSDLVLREAPDVRILATSREGLALDGEHIRVLRPLTVPDPSAELDAVLGSAAGRLFMDRALAVDSRFTLDASAGAAVGEVCRRLDGVPLAIELAAARVVAMSPPEIAARLDERFRLLTSGRRNAVERHQTLRATVDWSYSLLSPTEQLVFDRLTVFMGTFDASTAVAVVAADGVEAWDVVDALASLVAKSMVVGDHAANGVTRYSMLETLRAYALERLEETGDAQRWRRRHAEHYAAFAELAGTGLEGPDEHAWRERVRAELDNIRAAVGSSFDSPVPADAQPGLRIVAALAYEAVVDMTADVGVWVHRAVPRADETTPGRRTAILGTAALQATYRGDYGVAHALALDALCDGLPPDCPVPGPAHSALAATELRSGRPEEAQRVMRRGLGELETVAAGDAFKLSEFHSLVSTFARLCGDIATARAEADEALRLAGRVGSPSALAMALWASGKASLRADPAAAVVALEDYIDLARGGAKIADMGAALADVAWLKARDGDHLGALGAARDSVLHEIRSGNRAMLAIALYRTRLALVELGYSEPAAVLTGVETEGPFAEWDVFGNAEPETRDRELALHTLRAALGPEQYARAFARGAAMTYDEVVEYTVGELERLLVNTVEG